MTSQARIDANQKNAQHSTGPKTDAGKAKSSRNALKHGLTAEAAVLPNENPADFEAHVNHWLDSDPDADATQLALAETHRHRRMETEPLHPKRNGGPVQARPPRRRGVRTARISAPRRSASASFATPSTAAPSRR